MRAVVLHEVGPPDRLLPEEVADPVAGPGEVLIDVEWAGVTFVETQVRAGRPPSPAMAPQLPVVLGNGVGGRVVAAGEGVAPATVGRRVIAPTGGRGGYAERAVAAAEAIVEVPEEVGLADAVALLADGRTALALMDIAAVRPGETVLVEAAAGGVGSLLVQLARGAGAEVVAAAGGPEKLDHARRLGAGVAVDYRDAGWVDAVRTRSGGVDVVFDGVGGAIGRAAFGLLRPGGRAVAFGMASGAFAEIGEDEATARGVTRVGGLALPPERQRELVRRALEAAAAGRLRPVVGQIHPLEQAARAHAAIEARATIGKTLLAVGAAARAGGA